MSTAMQTRVTGVKQLPTCSYMKVTARVWSRSGCIQVNAAQSNNPVGPPPLNLTASPFPPVPLRNPPQVAMPVDGAFKASGKTVVITGGSQGVGRACAIKFAQKGYNVVVAARDPAKLRYVADDCAEIAGRQGASLAVTADVTKERDVKDLANAVLSKYESIDVVINCAGVFARGPFQNTPVQEAKRLMDTNYFGTYIVSQNFLPILVQSAKLRGFSFQKPTLVMVAGFAGKVPLKYMTAFTASKWAVVGLAEGLRTEVEPLGVHLSLVNPGLVKSNFMERSEFYGAEVEDERRNWRQMVRALPLSQTPQEVADAIFEAVQSQQKQVQVGAPFLVADLAYNFLGVNASEFVQP